jgi:hypothetical protein
MARKPIVQYCGALYPILQGGTIRPMYLKQRKKKTPT